MTATPYTFMFAPEDVAIIRNTLTGEIDGYRVTLTDDPAVQTSTSSVIELLIRLAQCSVDEFTFQMKRAQEEMAVGPIVTGENILEIINTELRKRGKPTL